MELSLMSFSSPVGDQMCQHGRESGLFEDKIFFAARDFLVSLSPSLSLSLTLFSNYFREVEFRMGCRIALCGGVCVFFLRLTEALSEIRTVEARDWSKV